MAETERKKRQRRNGTEQVEDVQKAIRRARVTFITEGNEKMAECMNGLGVELDRRLANREQAAE